MAPLTIRVGTQTGWVSLRHTPMGCPADVVRASGDLEHNESPVLFAEKKPEGTY